MAQKVHIYSLSTCSHCKRTKKFLDDANVEYNHVDVDLCKGEEREKVIGEVKKYNPSTTFPTILIGDQVIVGFKEDEIKRALGIK